MKSWPKIIMSLIVCGVCSVMLCSAADSSAVANGQAKSQNLRFGVVNFKKCVENSNIGKQEQTSFENLKKQMENVLGEKEKAMNDMASKFNDPDYLDSLSPEAETELKRKFRQQNQELAQLQSQYMQNLQQTNLKVIQKLNDLVTKASERVAKDEKLDVVFNEEAFFFYSPAIDITSKVVALLNEDFAKEQTSENTHSQPSEN